MTEELPRTRPDELEPLPELPEGVVVPDDLRGLAPPPSRPVRWLRWAAGFIVVAAVALAVAMALTGDGEQMAATQVEEDTKAYYEHLYENTASIRIEQDTTAYYQHLYENTAPIRIEQDIRAYYEGLYESIG